MAKLIVITGVTRGLGRAMAEEFARLRHTVAGCGRSQNELIKLSGKLQAPHRFAIVDVTSDEQVAAWARETITALGPPELLLNNAAIINRNAPLWLVPAEEFSDVIDVNIKGVTNVIRHFAPAMIERGRGVIVNFS